jgi:hypothetical protein
MSPGQKGEPIKIDAVAKFLYDVGLRGWIIYPMVIP